MPDVVALCYHATSPAWPNELSVEPDALARQVRMLLDRGYAPVRFADLLAGARGRRVAVTFDDAYRSTYELAWPALRELGVPATVYAPVDFVGGNELAALYRSSDAFLHVSWTEGAPQVLLEAFAAGLPVVATAVGGVAEQAADAALLVTPGRADEAAEALARLAAEAPLRERLAEHGRARVRERTLEAEAGRVARFIAEAAHA